MVEKRGIVYREPMEPYPGLERFSQTIDLPHNKLRLFYFDSGDVKTAGGAAGTRSG